jgi:hypothetical protein
MSDKEFVIEMEDDTQGHGWRGVVEPEDADWLEDRLRRDSGKTSFSISLGDEDDTEGHRHGAGHTLRLNLTDEDDTEGHAIAIHFPSRAEADAFRRRLLVTGVLVGTVALGAAGGVGLSALQSDAGSAGSTGTVATQQAGPMDVHEAPAFQAAAAPIDANADVGIMDASNAAAATQTGPMDAHEAPAFQNAGLSDADQAYADRLSGQAAAMQTGPMDAHEAPAFQNAGLSDADQAYADRLTGQAKAAQTGPMDAHEAPAFQQSSATSVDADSDIGIMDASGATGTDAKGAPSYVDAARNQALQNQADSDDDASSPDLKGPAPR